MASPKLRRRARERALQFLFGLDFTRYDWQEVLEDFWDTNPSRPGVKRYAEKLIKGVMDHRAELDQTIAESLENWSLDRVGCIERNVIRVALFEIRHVPDVPVPVAINEALEVAKQYGADEAPRFVNGVLDKLKHRPGEEDEET